MAAAAAALTGCVSFARGTRGVATRAAEGAPAEEAAPESQEEDETVLDVEYDDELPPPKVWDPAEQVGVTEPLGYFDPLGFCKRGEEMGFFKLRAAELKHGRVAMLATVGLVVQHYVRLPGFESCDGSFSSQFDAVFKVPGCFQFSAFICVLLFLELSLWAQADGREPGDFGDPLGLGMYDKEMRNRELNNGRFAMFAAIGIIVAEAATDKDGIQQLGLA